MGSTKIESHGNIGDDKIQYQLKINTGHVENTDTPNRVPYTFSIPEEYILQKFKFNESSCVGNCYINYAIENNAIRLEAVAQAVRDASRLWYKAGGHLKGTAIITFQKITPETQEINYEFNIDTGHVENTDLPNRVSYSFPIDFHLLEQSYTVSKFEFSESSRVGNCFIHPTIEKGAIKIEAVAQAVKASSGLWYQAGGHLKGTVRVALRKTEYVGIQSKHEASQATITMNGNQFFLGDIYSEFLNFGRITGDVSTKIEQKEVSVMTTNESKGNISIGNVGGDAKGIASGENIAGVAGGDITGNIQATQGDNNQVGSSEEQLTAQQVIELLAYLENRIQDLEALPKADREKSIKRIEAVKVEAEETEPDKESIAKGLKRVNEGLTEASKTTKGVKEFITEVAPTVAKIAGWLGYAVGSIWMV